MSGRGHRTNRTRGGLRPTISDVAATAGVSTATVSRVLNGHNVSGETAARVQAAVTALDYTSNALTRGVFAGKSSTIGVVIQDLSSPFYLDLIRGIDAAATAHGSLVTFANTFGHRDQEGAHIRTMDEQRVRGLILTTGPNEDARPRRMASEGTPCVVVARRIEQPGPNLHSISLDNVDAGRLIASHLLACGKTSIGVISIDSDYHQSQRERLEGIRQTLHAARNADVVVRDVHSAEDLHEVLPRALTDRAGNKSPDALVCLSGRLTRPIYQRLQSLGLRIPEDIALIAMDDFAWADVLGLTVVTQPSYEMGLEAANLIARAPQEPTQLVMKAQVIVRRSCGET